MRISDWSSDVCSSDLRVDGRTSVPLAITNQRDIGYFRPIRQRRWIRLLSRAAPGSRNASGVDRNRMTGLWNRRYPASRCTRSEEHTSELQSLMRISYAVFCLKKKTTLQSTNK